MTDKIEEIRKRHSKRSEIDQSGCYRLDGFTYMGSLSQSQEDVATLLAEDARHRAEIDGLRAALRECACACSSIRECYSEWAKDNYCLHLNARNALEGKP